jgi:hypothetical protein
MANDVAGYPPASKVNAGFNVSARPTHGELMLAADGSFTYTPVANYHGSDSFQDRIRHEGEWSNVATISLLVAECVARLGERPLAHRFRRTVGRDRQRTMDVIACYRRMMRTSRCKSSSRRAA